MNEYKNQTNQINDDDWEKRLTNFIETSESEKKMAWFFSPILASVWYQTNHHHDMGVLWQVLYFQFGPKSTKPEIYF